MTPAKALIARVTDVQDSDASLYIDYSCALYTADNRKEMFFATVFFDYTTSQTVFRNRVKDAVIAEAANRGYSVANNDILYALQA